MRGQSHLRSFVDGNSVGLGAGTTPDPGELSEDAQHHLRRREVDVASDRRGALWCPPTRTPLRLAPANVGGNGGPAGAAPLVGRRPLTARPAVPVRYPDSPTHSIRENQTLPTNVHHSDSDEVFQAFVRELASSAQPDLLARLKLGHRPDERGWCQHTSHEHHREPHPCPALRLARMVEVQQGDDAPVGPSRPVPAPRRR